MDKVDDKKLLLQVLKDINISTLLLLKLFDDITKDVISTKYKIPFNIQSLCFAYGLVNCYITSDYKLLKLIFNAKEALKDKKLTKSYYSNIIDLLIDSSHFYSISNITIEFDKFIVINLRIPKEFIGDIANYISNNKYSKVSEEFKNEMQFKNSSLPFVDNDIANYIAKTNLPYRVITNHTKLIDITYDALKSDHIIVSDFKDEELKETIKKSPPTIKFKPSKEIYNFFNFKKYANNKRRRRYT